VSEAATDVVVEVEADIDGGLVSSFSYPKDNFGASLSNLPVSSPSESGNNSIFFASHTGQTYSLDLHQRHFEPDSLQRKLFPLLRGIVQSTNRPHRYYQQPPHLWRPFVGKNPISPINAVRTTSTPTKMMATPPRWTPQFLMMSTNIQTHLLFHL
jgi:hypothetical protein